MSAPSKKWRWVRALVFSSAVTLVVTLYVISNSTATKLQNIKNSDNLVISALTKLPVRPAASMAGYSRQQFGGGWETVGGCDMREHILAESLSGVVLKSKNDCTVLDGILNDPYSGKTIRFVRGQGTSNQVQIDHVIALGDAWRTGAQNLSLAKREQLYNDPLELLAVYGPANDQKGDSDAAAWMPPNKAYDCRYVARQIAVKIKYKLWVTPVEHGAMQKVLNLCPGQQLPAVKN